MQDLIDLTSQLIAIESVNPDLVPGGAGEAAAARFVQGWLDARGFSTHWLEGTPGRPSVVGVLRGSGGGRSLLLNGHLDTVTLAGYAGEPLLPRLAGEQLHGRGSYDMKSGVAAMLIAAERAARQGLHGDLIVACVADEENASLGSQELVAQFHADAAIVTEPTELQLVTAHKGFVWATLTTHGLAAHGSRPDLGVDAIAKMGRALLKIEQLGAALRAGPAHPLLGSGSIHASIIAGGAERSSYPASCTLEIERRTIPGENAATLRAELEALISACVAEDPAFRASLAIGLERAPFETPADAAILNTLRGCAAAVLGQPPAEQGVSYWADAALLGGAGIPTVMFGVAGAGAHAATEYVELQSLGQLAEILAATIVTFCG
jgi:acetylornithine deacetylase